MEFSLENRKVQDFVQKFRILEILTFHPRLCCVVFQRLIVEFSLENRKVQDFVKKFRILEI